MVTLSLVIVNGLLDSLNPCAIGVLVLYLSFLFTVRATKKDVVIFGSFYIAAMYVTYLLIGLGLLSTFHLFGIHNFFGWLASILVIIVGLFSIKEYFWPKLYIPILSPFFARCRIPKWDQKISIVSALTLGFLVGLCEFPCTGGIYLATVALLSAKETFINGLLYLLLYNLMFVAPLIFLFAISSNQAFLKKMSYWQGAQSGKIKLIAGIAMILMGAAIIIWIM